MELDGTLTSAEFDTLFAKHTLGRLLRGLRRRYTFHEDAIEMLEISLQARNEFCHDFFWAHGEDLLSERGTDTVAVHLAKLIELFELADSHLTILGELARQELRIPAHAWKVEFHAMLKRAQARDGCNLWAQSLGLTELSESAAQ